MNSIDMVVMSIRNLFRRKLRTVLTVLGIIIGTTSIVLMLSLGIAMDKNFEEQLKRWGNLTVIEVMPKFDEASARAGRDNRLTDDDVKTLGKIPNVEMVIPELQVNLMLKSGRYYTHATVYGMTLEAMKALDYIPSKGRLFEQNEEYGAVFGFHIQRRFMREGSKGMMHFNPNSKEEPLVNVLQDPLTLSFRMGEKAERPIHIEGIGILPETQYETAHGIYMPLETVKKLQEKEEELQQSNNIQQRASEDGYRRLKIKVNDIENVEEVQKKIKQMGFEAWSKIDGVKSVKEASASIRAFLGAIGAVSLLVAALGITNTMIMAIYERTREIGIMKVIGAAIYDIKRMFLIESAFVGFIGGALGISVSYILSHFLNSLSSKGNPSGILRAFAGAGPGSKLSVIPLWLALAALGFSTLIGLIAGYFPARRAMKLSALSAIKTE